MEACGHHFSVQTFDLGSLCPDLNRIPPTQEDEALSTYHYEGLSLANGDHYVDYVDADGGTLIAVLEEAFSGYASFDLHMLQELAMPPAPSDEVAILTANTNATPTCYTPIMKTRHAVQLVCLLLNAIGISKSNYKSEAELRQWLELCFPSLVLETRKVKKKKGVDFAYNEHALYGLEGHEAVHRILVFVRKQVALVGATLPDVPSAELFRTEGEYYATLPDGKKLTVTDEMRAKLTGVLGYDPGSLPSPLSAASIQSWWLSHDRTQLALPMELA